MFHIIGGRCVVLRVGGRETLVRLSASVAPGRFCPVQSAQLGARFSAKAAIPSAPSPVAALAAITSMASS